MQCRGFTGLTPRYTTCSPAVPWAATPYWTVYQERGACAPCACHRGTSPTVSAVLCAECRCIHRQVIAQVLNRLDCNPWSDPWTTFLPVSFSVERFSLNGSGCEPTIVTNPDIHRAGSTRPFKVEPFPLFGLAPAPSQSPCRPTGQLDRTEAPVAGNFRLAWNRD